MIKHIGKGAKIKGAKQKGAFYILTLSSSHDATGMPLRFFGFVLLIELRELGCAPERLLLGTSRTSSTVVPWSSSTLHVLTSANLVPCPHQPLAAWAMNDKEAVYCFLFYPSFRGLGRWSIEMGLTPPPHTHPLNPGRPLREQERAP